MSNTKVISPGVGIKRGNLLIKTLNYFLKPFLDKIKDKINPIIWSHHADERTLEVDWKKIGFNRVALINFII